MGGEVAIIRRNYRKAWEHLQNVLREEKKLKENRREDLLRGGVDPGLPAIHYVTVLNLMANLERDYEV